MAYHVIAFTMAQIGQGGLAFHRALGTLPDLNQLKIYSASPFDLEERARVKRRFGGDIVYFFNDAARQAAERLGLDLQFVAEVADEDLPRRPTLVIGIPDKRGS